MSSKEPKIKVLPQSGDFKEYFAESVGISDVSYDDVKFFDMTFLNRLTRPTAKEINNDNGESVYKMESSIHLQHICTIKMTKQALKDLSELIDMVLNDSESEKDNDQE